MNRADILKQFNVDARGLIRNPGKFEGEMLYVPYFYDAFLDGLPDYEKGNSVGFHITAEDRAEFPEIPKRQRTIWLWLRDDGFVQEV